MDDDLSFSDVLSDLTQPSKKRDPRSIRLAAVTSALVDVATDGGSAGITAAKVYVSTVTALEGTLQSKDDSQVANSLSTQVALLELLQITVSHVEPAAILKATLPVTSRVLRAVVASVESVGSDAMVMETKDELGGINAVLRWACRASTEVLKRLDPTADEKAVKQLFAATLLTLFRDRRSKVRKVAYNGAVELLNMGGDGDGAVKCHPVITRTATAYVHAELSKAQRNKKSQNETLGDLLHLLSFLERSILHLDYAKLGTDIMQLLAVLFQLDGSSSATDFVAVVKVKEVTPKLLAISALLSIVVVILEDQDMDRKQSLDEFSTRVLASLLQAKPSLVFRNGSSDVEILQRGRTFYGQTILVACRRIMAVNVDLACKLAPLGIEVVLMLSQPNEEDPDDATVSQTLMVELTQLFRTRLSTLISSKPQGLEKCLTDTLQAMQQVMQSIYRPTWSVSLKCLGVFLQLLHTSDHSISDNVESLVELHSHVPEGSASQLAVEDAVASLIQGVGIEVFWRWIQWQEPQGSSKRTKNGISVKRAWILPTLKTASMAAQAKQPRLSFFQTDILALARTSDKLAATIFVERNFHLSTVVDLWGLFPSFCKRPSDLKSALPPLTITLARALEDDRYPQLVTIICNGITTLIDSIKDENTTVDDADSEAAAAAAVKLLPVMFKIVSSTTQTGPSGKRTGGKDDTSMDVDVDDETSSSAPPDADAQNIRSITDAIASLAKLAPSEFLHGLFKKLMHRLLEEVQSENGDSGRICALLSLSQALVASRVLDDSSIGFLYRAIKPLVRNDEHEHRVQKRSYKVLAEICEHNHSFVTEQGRLEELTELLTGTIVTSHVAARHMRLKCMNIIVDGLKETNSDTTAIFNITAEVLLCLKDSNAKTREAAYQLLLSMASLDGIGKLLQVVTAALGAETAHMRSASVMALSRIVFEIGWESEGLRPLLPSLLKTVLVLIDEDSREVVKSVVGFIRISVAAIPPEQLEPLLPDLIDGLMKYHKAKDRFRAKIKIILKKLVRHFGYDALLPFVPQSETRLLTHMRKLDERQKRRKAALRAEGRPDAAGFEDMVDSDEEDSDDGRTLMTGATGVSRLTGRSITSKKSVGDRTTASKANRTMGASSVATSKSNRKSDATIRLPDETDGEVVDMLSSSVSKRVKFADDDMDDSDSDDGGVMEFDDDGRLVVRDDLYENATKSQTADDSTIDPGSMQANKRRRTSKFETEKTKRDEAGKKQPVKRTRDLGSSYKSKKAGGDVKRKGQRFEPYAFVPLDGRSYTKKNRRAAVEQMSSVVRKGGKRKKN